MHWNVLICNVTCTSYLQMQTELWRGVGGGVCGGVGTLLFFSRSLSLSHSHTHTHSEHTDLRARFTQKHSLPAFLWWSTQTFWCILIGCLLSVSTNKNRLKGFLMVLKLLIDSFMFYISYFRSIISIGHMIIKKKMHKRNTMLARKWNQNVWKKPSVWFQLLSCTTFLIINLLLMRNFIDILKTKLSLFCLLMQN